MWGSWKTDTGATHVVHTTPDLPVAEHQLLAQTLGSPGVQALGPSAASIGLGSACERGAKHQARLEKLRGSPYQYDKVRGSGVPGRAARVLASVGHQSGGGAAR